MRIGLTFDLRSDYLKEGYTEEETAEFDKESTVEAIERELHFLGHSTERIGHILNLTRKLVSGERWDLVFNISEGLYGIGREAQVPAILDAYKIPYTFSDPLVLALTLHKGMTKHVIRDCGIPTPDFAIVSSMKDLGAVDLPYPLFVKPNAEGSGKGIAFNSKVSNPEELRTTCADRWKERNFPLLVETYLPGREFTVGILGTGEESFSVGAMEVIFRQTAGESIYSYDMKANYEQFVDYALPEPEVMGPICEMALKAWKALECRDGGRVDVRLDAQGITNFIEVNPLAGLNDITSDLPILARMNGYDYSFIIKTVIDSAVKRIKQ
ncbi:MAG: D-alanine--D-alanine ligase [Bacteroidetes bacterium]|nr:D-alanine--D-alanine ligase [Bacteroidota bacterium]